MKPPPGIAQFDSAAAFAQSLARFLHGRDFSGLGQPPALQWLVRQSDLLPRRQRLNFFAGWAAREGISPGKIEMVNAHAVAEWLAGLYPARRYPAVMIGSSNGALVHLCAAFGIPWLPQTFLTVIKRRHDPDDPIRALEQERETAQVFLALNPDVQLHQFFDPNQDRLTLARLAYFRSKFLRLPPAYTQFLADRLEPGGRIIIADCGLRWPTTRLGPRHRFQFGEVGGATVEEYFHGGPRVEAALQRHGRPLRRWQPPPPNGESPEAEWGFEPALGNDLADFARTRGFRLQRISFDAPERPSPLVADFHRSWHRERGLPGNRLVIESFIAHDPYRCLHAGAVPFWTVFNMQPSLNAVNRYLDEGEPFDEIYLMLFAHGVDAVGLPPIDAWHAVLRRARTRGAFLGLTPDTYPAHFSHYGRYSRELRRLAPPLAMPKPLPIDRLEWLIRSFGPSHEVQLVAA
ncbi:MAG TPA: hypothetical protein VFB27_05740 [Opitutaceae bacterium]|nr:hypothetical protein [Opitutaceae bacterium]